MDRQELVSKLDDDELLKLYVDVLRAVHLRRALPHYKTGDVFGFGRGAFKRSLQLFLDRTGNETTVPPGSACIEWGVGLITTGGVCSRVTGL